MVRHTNVEVATDDGNSITQILDTFPRNGRFNSGTCRPGQDRYCGGDGWTYIRASQIQIQI